MKWSNLQKGDVIRWIYQGEYDTITLIKDIRDMSQGEYDTTTLITDIRDMRQDLSLDMYDLILLKGYGSRHHWEFDAKSLDHNERVEIVEIIASGVASIEEADKIIQEKYPELTL